MSNVDGTNQASDCSGPLQGLILAIETSCDESALALFDGTRGLEDEWISSQIDLHSEYGGVVPDLASREHLTNLPHLLARAAGSLTASRRPRAIAVTKGPGLAGCLAMGLSAAKSLALAWGCRLYGVNHLRAHAFSPFIGIHTGSPSDFETAFRDLLPHLGLVVSGGNTLLLRIDEGPSLSLIGGTIDDAAGEALDKGAKLLGLGYPGGPKIEREAASGRSDVHVFPRALLRAGNSDFSFSGLKTSLRYRIQDMTSEEISENLPALCAGYQEAVVDVLGRKLEAELAGGDYRSVGLSGGVANNRSLRDRVRDVAGAMNLPGLAAEPRHTGDNAGMIAFAAWMERAHLVPDEGFATSIQPALAIERI